MKNQVKFTKIRKTKAYRFKFIKDISRLLIINLDDLEEINKELNKDYNEILRIHLNTNLALTRNYCKYLLTQKVSPLNKNDTISLLISLGKSLKEVSNLLNKKLDELYS